MEPVLAPLTQHACPGTDGEEEGFYLKSYCPHKFKHFINTLNDKPHIVRGKQASRLSLVYSIPS
jgi:hypothetical protein